MRPFFTVHISGMKRAESFIGVEKKHLIAIQGKLRHNSDYTFTYIPFLVSFSSIHIREIT